MNIKEAVCCAIYNLCTPGVVDVEVYLESAEEDEDLCSNSVLADTLIFTGKAIFDPKPNGGGGNKKNLYAKTRHEHVSYDVGFYFCPDDYVAQECHYILFNGNRYEIETVEVAMSPDPITSLAYCHDCD